MLYSVSACRTDPSSTDHDPMKNALEQRWPAVMACLLVLYCTPVSLGEYRVALLIGNSNYTKPEEKLAAAELDEVAKSLSRYGFACTIIKDVANEYGFRDAIETFAGASPSCSTALVYFRGRLSEDAGWVAVDSRSRYALSKTVEVLNDRGGSRTNLVFVDSPDSGVFDEQQPANFHVTYGSTDKLLSQLDGKTDLIEALAGAGKSKGHIVRRD